MNGVPIDRIPVEYVSSYSLYQREGSPESYSSATWADAIDVLLPKTDEVTLVLEGDRLQVDWETLMECAGERLTPVEATVPPLYKTHGFPDPLQIDKIRRAHQADGK